MSKLLNIVLDAYVRWYMLNCKFCDTSRETQNSIKNHELRCRQNPNRLISWLENPNNTSRKHNQYTKAERLGLPKPQFSKDTIGRLSAATTKNNLSQSEETKLKRRNTIANKVANGEWHTSLAKKMHYRYKGIDMHGKWEYNYAVWLDENKIQWERCKESFEYEFGGKQRRYTPDFYLKESDTYVEIKGYKTEKDEAKWNQFPKHRNLKVLMGKDLISLGIEINSAVAD